MTVSPKNLTGHIALWFRWRWFLIGITFTAALLTAIISTLAPKTYRSTAVVMPPPDGRSPFSFMEGISIDIFGRSEIPPFGLITLLRSNALKDRVHQRIDLMEHYQKGNLEEAYIAFEDHLTVELESETSLGSIKIHAISISVLDREPEFCAKLVNTIVEEWDGLFIEISRRSAGLRRQFVEENLLQTSAQLAAVEDSLRAFQEFHGIAALNVQVEGTVASAIALEQKITDARIVVSVLERLFGPEHPELKRAKLQLQELQKQQKRFQEPSDGETLLLPLGIAPEISLKYTRIFRRVKTLEAIHRILVQQYEQSRMQELKDTPALRIVDHGNVPIHKFKPRRLFLVLVSVISAFFLSLLLIYFLDYMQRVKGTEEYRWIEEINEHLKADRQRLCKFFRRKS